MNKIFLGITLISIGIEIRFLFIFLYSSYILSKLVYFVSILIMNSICPSMGLVIHNY